jgi:hypothetical protein
MSTITVIPKATAAGTFSRIIDKGKFPKTLQLDGIIGAEETIPIYCVGADGAVNTDVPAYNEDGTAPLALSATRKFIRISGPCRISGVKGVTALAVGLMLIQVD